MSTTDESARELAVSRVLGHRHPPSEDEERYARAVLRHDLGARLMSAFADGSYYSVRVVEERRPGDDPWRGDTLVLRAEVRRVEVRQAIVWAPPDFAAMPLGDVAVTAVQELKRRAAWAVTWEWWKLKEAVRRRFGSRGGPS